VIEAPADHAGGFCIGVLSRYWQERYALPPAKLVAWTGDNPSSLIGTGLVTTGRCDLAGHGDTVFKLMPSATSDEGVGHIRCADWRRHGPDMFPEWIARARTRARCSVSTGRILRRPATDTGRQRPRRCCRGSSEITPDVPVAGVHRLGLPADDAARNVRGVIEAQMMAMANHCADGRAGGWNSRDRWRGDQS
jgi:hypothetical protein